MTVISRAKLAVFIFLVIGFLSLVIALSPFPLYLCSRGAPYCLTGLQGQSIPLVSVFLVIISYASFFIGGLISFLSNRKKITSMLFIIGLITLVVHFTITPALPITLVSFALSGLMIFFERK